MSSRLVELCVAILEDYFGFYVSHVGNLLLREQLTLHFIIKNLQLKGMTIREIKRSLAILDQHNLLHFETNLRASVLYTIIPEQVLQLIRAPRAILVIKTIYDAIAEAVFEDILAQGRTSCSDCIRRVSKCLDNMAFDKVKDDFVRLTDAQIIIRCDIIKDELDPLSQIICPVFEPEPDPFLMPDVILDAESSFHSAQNTSRAINTTNGKTMSRKRKFNNDSQIFSIDSDANILWRINWKRMERFFRDDLILDAIYGSGGNELLDKSALRVAQLLLKVGEMRSTLLAGQSSPISLQDVCRYVREHQLDYLREQIDEKLNIVGRDTAGIVRKVGDSGGGLYIINYEKGIESLCLEHIESTIREKIGDKAVRIFRLLRSKDFLEEEQIEKEAMLSTKETKELCCALIDNNYITTRQIAKANDFAPARTIFLYSVNMVQLLGSLIHFTNGAIRNVIRRRILEREKHDSLLDRQLKMEVIINSIMNNPNFAEENEDTRKEQIVEVEKAYMTAEDKRILERFRHAERRLWSSEIELERVQFALLQFLQLRRRSNAEQQRQKASQGRKKRTAPQS